MEWGPREKFLLDISGETPAAPLLEKPSLDEIEQYYWRVFQELSASRAARLAVGFIPVSEIFAYCQMFGIEDQNDRSDLLYIIGEMDGAYVEYMNEKSAGRMGAGV